MTKADLVNNIAEKTGIDKKAALLAVEAMMEEIKECMAKKGENVYLRGFGTFVVKKRAKKTARNISRNTTIVVPEHNIPSFKAAKCFVQDMK